MSYYYISISRVLERDERKQGCSLHFWLDEEKGFIGNPGIISSGGTKKCGKSDGMTLEWGKCSIKFFSLVVSLNAHPPSQGS